MIRGALLWPATAIVAGACFVDVGGEAGGTTTSTSTSSGGASTTTAASEGTTSTTTTTMTTTTAMTTPATASESDTGATTGEPTTTTTTTTTGPSPFCGDGIVDADEECDEGAANGPGGACREDCTFNVCGDGGQGPGEACDDGNVMDGDGCSAVCAIEPPTKLYIFATAGKFTGDLGGLANADDQCAIEATSAGLMGTFYAWLSVDEATSPAARFTPHDLPIVLPGADEVLVAQGTAQLLSGSHASGIVRSATGEPVDVGDGDCNTGSLAWTGTSNDGKPDENSCSGFTNGVFGAVGLAGKVKGNGSGWSSNCLGSCAWALRLYCVQQP